MKQRNTFTFPETLVVNCHIDSPKSYDVPELIKVILYNIYNISNCTINIIRNDNLLKRFSKEDLMINALADKTPIPHMYNIFLSNNLSESLEIILCHELCHISQYERGDLDIKKENDKLFFSWKGTQLDPKIEYWKRPWEKEAREQSYKLWKQFKKIYYK